MAEFTKICTKCKVDKSLSSYSKRNDRLLGYESRCKACKAQSKKEWYRTKNGLIKVIYNNQIKSSIKRKHEPPSYTFKQLKEWVFEQSNFDTLFNSWNDSGYNKNLIPSIDRLRNDEGYSFWNIQLVTFEENNNLGHKSMRDCEIIHGKNPQKETFQFELNGTFVKSYSSLMNMERATGFKANVVSRVCLGSRKTAYGYIWSYKEEV